RVADLEPAPEFLSAGLHAERKRGMRRIPVSHLSPIARLQMGGKVIVKVPDVGVRFIEDVVNIPIGVRRIEGIVADMCLDIGGCWKVEDVGQDLPGAHSETALGLIAPAPTFGFGSWFCLRGKRLIDVFEVLFDPTARTGTACLFAWNRCLFDLGGE